MGLPIDDWRLPIVFLQSHLNAPKISGGRPPSSPANLSQQDIGQISGSPAGFDYLSRSAEAGGNGAVNFAAGLSQPQIYADFHRYRLAAPDKLLVLNPRLSVFICGWL